MQFDCMVTPKAGQDSREYSLVTPHTMRYLVAMRKIMATILAVCFGILLPAAAIPVRVCLLHPGDLSGECCGNCATSHQDCCTDFKTVPYSTMPDGHFETPAFAGYVIPDFWAELPCIPESIAPPPCFARPPTGIGTPMAHRAVLNVWRL